MIEEANGKAGSSKWPQNTKVTFTAGRDQTLGPARGLFLFEGTKMGSREFPGKAAPCTVYTLITVAGAIQDGQLAFCVRPQVNPSRPNNQVTVTEQWYDRATYTAMHMGLVAKYDMEPNRTFDVGVGVMDKKGERLGGTNRLWHTNPWG